MPMEAYPLPPCLDDTTMEELNRHVFGLDSFYVHQVQLTPVGAVFRGAPRRSDAAVVNRLVQHRLLAHTELAKRIRLFMVRDPTSFTLETDEFESAWDDDIVEPLEPVFLALPTNISVAQ